MDYDAHYRGKRYVDAYALSKALLERGLEDLAIKVATDGFGWSFEMPPYKAPPEANDRWRAECKEREAFMAQMWKRKAGKP